MKQRQKPQTDNKFDQIWALMTETDRKMQETDRQMKETDRRMKKLEYMFTGHWGKLMEALVEGDLVHLLQKKGIRVNRTFSNIKGEFQGQRWEIDILAVNGQEAVVVEVKTTLKQKDVDQFIKFMKLFTTLNPEHKDKKIYGAVAFLKANNSTDIYAEKKGLYVIKAVGSSSSIINKENFQPKTF